MKTNNIYFKRTNSDDSDFLNNCKILDQYLIDNVGIELMSSTLSQHNVIKNMNHVMVMFFNNELVGSAALKTYSEDTIELKRFIILEKFRGKGYGKLLFEELSKWAKELNYKRVILETAKALPIATKFYLAIGCKLIEHYGVYKDIEECNCLEWVL